MTVLSVLVSKPLRLGLDIDLVDVVADRLPLFLEPLDALDDRLDLIASAMPCVSGHCRFSSHGRWLGHTRLPPPSKKRGCGSLPKLGRAVKGADRPVQSASRGNAPRGEFRRDG